MRVESLAPVLNVRDVPASVGWFERLGWRRSFTWNDGGMIEGAGLEDGHGPAEFAGLCAAPAGEESGVMVFLCKDGQGSRDSGSGERGSEGGEGGGSSSGVWMSWFVGDVDAAHGECEAAGVEILRGPVDEPWGVREFLIRHPDGHVFRVSGPTG